MFKQINKYINLFKCINNIYYILTVIHATFHINTELESRFLQHQVKPWRLLFLSAIPCALFLCICGHYCDVFDNQQLVRNILRT